MPEQTQDRKPHPMARRAATPCPVCNSGWVRPAVDLANPDAEELPIYDACASCKTRREEVSHA